VTGLAMPPVEPPAPDVDEVLELLRVARVQLGHARARAERVKHWQADPMNDPADRMRFRVMRATREHEVQAWADEVTALEARARRMGVRA
jgi:hypothetical protein